MPRKRSREDPSALEPSKKTKFLDEVDDESGAEEELGFKINEEYARRFEHNNKRRELQKLEEKYGKDSVKIPRRRREGDLSDDDESGSSSDEDEDDDGEFATADLDAEINETLNAIRNKDPRVYDKDVKFYSEFEPADEEGGVALPQQPKQKSMTLKDYHRENFLAAARGEDHEENAPKTYVQEQADLKNDLVKALHDAADDEKDSGEEGDGFLFKAKGKPAIKTTAVLPDPATADKDPENFLSNFFAARAWVPSGDSRFAHLESDDDEEERRADAFEEAYNLRFEDPEVSNQKLISHSRDAIAEFSVRREEKTSRKKARERERQKKEEGNSERDLEKARLRKLKVEQIEGKVDMIRRAAGGRDIDIADWAGVLDEDWDDERFDAEMRKRFGDEYYGESDDGAGGGSSDEEATSKKNGKDKKKSKKPSWDDDIDIKDLIPDFQDDEQVSLSDNDNDNVENEDGDEKDGPTITTKSLKQQKASQKASSRRDRRIIESLVDQSLAIDGPLPQGRRNDGPRFSYRETSPSSFGLTPLDILAADDAQLNQWAGIKKLAAFRDPGKKEKDKKRLGKKGRLREWRKETFGSKEGPRLEDWYVEGAEILGSNGKEKDADADAVDIKEGSRKKRRRGKKKSAAPSSTLINTAKVASIFSSLSPYVPESLRKILPVQKKPPETLLTNLEAQLRPAYTTLVAQIKRLSDLLPRQSADSTPQGPVQRLLFETRKALIGLESFEPTLVAAFILTLVLVIRLFMSWYKSWSPFSRSGHKGDAEVSDSDFSYITADDLAKVNGGFTPSHNRDTDVLILKHKRVSYPVHFPAHSIDKGHLKIGEIRAAAAKKLELAPSEADRIKIFYRGKNLKDDHRTAKDEGLKSSSESELMIVVGEAPPNRGESSESEGEEDDGVDDSGTTADGKKKRRNRKRKGKKKNNNGSGTATPNSGYVNSNVNPDATFAPSGAPPPRPTPSPRPQAPPQTPIEKLETLSSLFHTKYVPDCVQYINSPPADKAKRDFDHKRLSETILAQILLKLDAVETEGNPDARQRRKDLVKEVQSILNKLDEVVKS